MKGNLHEDNFEDFIKNKINEFDGMPSDDIWNRIEGVIPPKPTVSIIKYLTPISAAASVALVAIALWWVVSDFKNENAILSEELKEATNKIEELSHQVEELKPIANTNTVEPVANVSSDNISTEKATLVPSIQKEKVKNTPSNGANNQIPPKKIINKNIEEQLPSSAFGVMPEENIVKKIDEKENAFAENTSTSQSTEERPVALATPISETANNYTPLAKVNYLTGKPITVLAFKTSLNEDKMLEPSKEKEIKQRRKAKGNWSAGVTVRPFYNKNFIKTPPGQPQKPIERQVVGLAIGGQINYQFNKNWSISLGMTHQSESAEIQIPNRINYDKANEIPFDSEFNICNHSYSANSPYGELNVNVDLFRNRNRNLNDGAPLDLNLVGLHERRSFNIPITVQYQRSLKKLKLGGRVGFAPQFTLENRFTASQVNVGEEGVLAQGVTLSQPSTFIKKTTFDGIIGLTAAYPLSKDWTLSVEPTAYIGLRNKFRSPQGASIQTAASGVQVGLSYQF